MTDDEILEVASRNFPKWEWLLCAPSEPVRKKAWDDLAHQICSNLATSGHSSSEIDDVGARYIAAFKKLAKAA